MPDLYCSCCRKITPHKMVMKRCCSHDDESFTGKLVNITHMMANFVSGNHYYKLEPQYFCRHCNQRNIDVSPMANKKAVSHSRVDRY